MATSVEAPRNPDHPCTDEYYDNDYMHTVQSQIVQYQKDLEEFDSMRQSAENPVVYESLSNVMADLGEFVQLKKQEYHDIPKVYVIDGNTPIDIVCRIDRGVTGKDINERASHVVDYDELRFMSGRVLSDDEYIKASADIILSSYRTIPRFGQ